MATSLEIVLGTNINAILDGKQRQNTTMYQELPPSPALSSSAAVQIHLAYDHEPNANIHTAIVDGTVNKWSFADFLPNLFYTFTMHFDEKLHLQLS